MAPLYAPAASFSDAASNARDKTGRSASSTGGQYHIQADLEATRLVTGGDELAKVRRRLRHNIGALDARELVDLTRRQREYEKNRRPRANAVKLHQTNQAKKSND